MERLRDAGVRVVPLKEPVDPADDHAIAAALRQASRDGAVVWLERGAAGRSPEPAAPKRAPTRRVAGAAGKIAGDAWRFIGRQLRGGSSLMIIPYIGFGNVTMLSVRGRVLDERAFRPQGLEDSGWRNLAALYQRLESDEVRGARVRASFNGVETETLTDRGGYFQFEIALPAPLERSGWHSVDLELPAPPGGAPVRAAAEVLVPPASARFGVISDIDDTVVWTNVTNKVNMALMLARLNPHTRRPFKGVAAFYRALHEGAAGNEANPVFYVSSSPWHLFEPLVEFMRLQGIPLGPLMLRELSVRSLIKPELARNHKLDKIESILRAYPDLKFVLIGDSGERDPEIYAEILRRHPQSVRVIYIRNVNPDPQRIEALDRLTEEVSNSGAQLVLAADSVAAASHAAAEGLIRVEALAQVRQDKRSGDE
ncbi:DUF2183 domain-containing protein [Massilia sp. R2A-15]|uniref:App1 family protein n=1 Tax=Massilia sp. R2A-15 TaxID=3064278 RepID=UPI0027352885|nr:phosphatase domain-containing protein [Massilia sp. R2A-15]WLI87690.1 DUF2183 domain-containing protein [Massilia sp. R2A-15]